MNILFKRLAVGVLLPSLLLLSACGSGQNESASADGIQARTIKAGIGNSKMHPQGKGMEKFKELVEEKKRRENESPKLFLMPPSEMIRK
ncbi:hypothetical protein RCO48_22315 [Peribacillus frigoritolerans]|nr:hypothetical protein [Peribacillus frigoritolerans]